MSYIEIQGGAFDLGWKVSDFPRDAVGALKEFAELSELGARFSEKRSVVVAPFSISEDCIKLGDLIQFDESGFDSVSDLKELCDVADRILNDWGQRVPTEDEWEVAFGAQAFPWGDIVPDGIPHNGETDFAGHLRPSPSGLNFNASSYVVELARTAYKLGDGGEAVCGGYPWPVAWISMGVSHRMVDSDIEDCFFEFMEDAEIRPVKA